MAKKKKEEAKPMKAGPKKVYSYSPYTGEYTGETLADMSPLEPGVYHIPANATEIEPPAKVDGKIRVFVDGKWNYAELEATTQNT